MLDAATKKEIGTRLRKAREQAHYSREQLGELCSLSPRFIANIEFGDSSLSLDSLMSICRVLSCSADYFLFGKESADGPWMQTADKLSQLPPQYMAAADKIFSGFIEAVTQAERKT